MVYPRISKESLCLSLFVVAKYTREAGVRTLERRIGGVCRAVAVRVAEHASKAKHEKMDVGADKKQVTNTNLPASLSQDVSTLAHPPEMPIVIDETALEDILGVR